MVFYILIWMVAKGNLFNKTIDIDVHENPIKSLNSCLEELKELKKHTPDGNGFCAPIVVKATKGIR